MVIGRGCYARPPALANTTRRHYRSAMAGEALQRMLARLIPIRPYIALGHFLVGAPITVVAFYGHSFVLAVIGLLILGGALGVLLIPLPYDR